MLSSRCFSPPSWSPGTLVRLTGCTKKARPASALPAGVWDCLSSGRCRRVRWAHLCIFTLVSPSLTTVCSSGCGTCTSSLFYWYPSSVTLPLLAHILFILLSTPLHYKLYEVRESGIFFTETAPALPHHALFKKNGSNKQMGYV